MDVKTKLKLMLVMESYWLMLPPELHELILAYKRSQEMIEERNKERMKELCNEIVLYDELKETWGLGRIECVTDFRFCHTCVGPHIKIYGWYVNSYENDERKKLLGYNLGQALGRANHVKSFL